MSQIKSVTSAKHPKLFSTKLEVVYPPKKRTNHVWRHNMAKQLNMCKSSGISGRKVLRMCSHVGDQLLLWFHVTLLAWVLAVRSSGETLRGNPWKKKLHGSTRHILVLSWETPMITFSALPLNSEWTRTSRLSETIHRITFYIFSMSMIYNTIKTCAPRSGLFIHMHEMSQWLLYIRQSRMGPLPIRYLLTSGIDSLGSTWSVEVSRTTIQIPRYPTLMPQAYSTPASKGVLRDLVIKIRNHGLAGASVSFHDLHITFYHCFSGILGYMFRCDAN